MLDLIPQRQLHYTTKNDNLQVQYSFKRPQISGSSKFNSLEPWRSLFISHKEGRSRNKDLTSLRFVSCKKKTSKNCRIPPRQTEVGQRSAELIENLSQVNSLVAKWPWRYLKLLVRLRNIERFQRYRQGKTIICMLWPESCQRKAIAHSFIPMRTNEWLNGGELYTFVGFEAFDTPVLALVQWACRRRILSSQL